MKVLAWKEVLDYFLLSQKNCVKRYKQQTQYDFGKNVY